MKNIFIHMFLLAIAGLSARCKGEDEICREAEEKRRFCLKNHKYKQIRADFLRQCYMTCTTESSCYSINFFLSAKKCEMNSATHSSKPEDFQSCEDSTYIENVNRVKKGSTPWAPGHSCKDIRQSEASVENGDYWINPSRSGEPIKVYCDMTTDKGGWTLIKKVELTDGSLPTSQEEIQTNDYKVQLLNYDSNLHLLVTKGLLNLKQDMSFDQMRFYCHKANPGRVFHIATKPDPLGEAVVQYFTGITNTPPQACDSYTAFQDDNSLTSGNCMEWGKSYLTKNRWGKNVTKQAEIEMYKRLVVWEMSDVTYAVAMGNSDYFCDDLVKEGSTGDKWEFYVR